MTGGAPAAKMNAAPTVTPGPTGAEHDNCTDRALDGRRAAARNGATMPSFVTPRLVFLHVPKTGGTWVAQAAAAAGVAAVAPDHPHYDAHYSLHGHADVLDTAGYAGRLRVAFVRHPLDWWRSYWGHRMRAGWTDGDIDRLASDDFNAFAAAVAERFPGHLAGLFERFVGTAAEPIEFIGRYESLCDDLCIALRAAAEPFDESLLRAHPPANSNDYRIFPAVYEPAVAAALAEAERAAIERFYWWDPLPARLIGAGAKRPRAQLAPATAERIQQLETSLRRSDAALAATRLRLHALEAERDDTRLELGREREAHARTGQALVTLRESRLLRLTRPARVRYYRLRSAAQPGREAPASSARVSDPAAAGLSIPAPPGAG